MSFSLKFILHQVFSFPLFKNHVLLFSEITQYKILEVYDGKVYVVGMTTGSEVKVVAIGQDGAVTATKSVLAGFLRKDTE